MEEFVEEMALEQESTEDYEEIENSSIEYIEIRMSIGGLQAALS